jgi:two-component system LytT family response regulator
MQLRTLIVEDEATARDRLRALCNRQPEIEVVACAESASQAIDAFAKLSPNLIFLDVELRGSTAFDVLRAMPEDPLPLIIFTTAYAKYAPAAFESAAIDYLVKPFSDERFHTTLERVRARVQLLSQVDARVGEKAAWYEMLSHLDGRRDRGGLRLFAEKQQRFFFLDPDEVESAVADRNCVTLTARGETYIARVSMRQLEAKLEATAFVRIHKSLMINLDHVRHMERAARGAFLITLRSGVEFRSSPIYRTRILERASGGT